MADALVTGCAGFIDSHVTDYLLTQGLSVVGLDCFTDYYSTRLKRANIRNAAHSSRFRLIEQDILSMSNYTFPDVDYVFHLAAQPGMLPSWGINFNIYSRNNIDATQRLLEAYKTRRLKKFVYASSSSVYGNASVPYSENDSPYPLSPYGMTKLAGEHICRIYSTGYGLSVICVRYFTVYGPRQRPDMAINMFIRAALGGTPVTIFGDGEQSRDFTYVDDVVAATVALSISPVSNGSPINVGGGCMVSVNDLIERIGCLVGTDVVTKHVPDVRGDPRHTLADTNKLKALLGWKPKTTIEDGLKRQYEWQRTNSVLGER